MKKIVLFSIFVLSFFVLSAQNNFLSKTKHQHAQKHNIIVKNLQKGQKSETSSPKANPKVSCNVQDSLALFALFNSTTGNSWTNKTGWKTDSVYKWYGVTLDTNGRVTNLNLYSNKLSGTIPAEIGDLTKLKFLYLDNNQLSGNIPAQIGNLTSLQGLTLYANQLTGNIPSEIGNLTKLQELELDDNQLSGNIPPQIGNLTKLQVLALYANQLTGAIPSEIGNLTNLQGLVLYANQLTGAIPSEIGNLNSLTYLKLSSNHLSGNIPAQIKNLDSLTYLELSSNHLSGNILAEIGKLTNLQVLDLSYNQFSGNIPAQIGNLTQLKKLVLTGNQLTKNVPSQIGNLTNLQMLFLNSNKFDSLPNLSALKNLFFCDIENNKFDFGDLQTARIFASFYYYSSQANIGDTTYFKFIEGNDYSFYDSVGGTDNQYQWFKNDTAIFGEKDSVLKLTNVSISDTGKYYCQITNPNFTGLTLQTQPFILDTSVFSVTFSVKDNNSSPVENAQIHIQNWNNSLFTDASGKNSTNLGTGNYTAIIYRTGFVNDTTAFSVTDKDININITLQAVTAIAQNSANRIVIYPNPASDNFFVKNAENSVMTITDMFGRRVLRTKLNSNNENIDVSKLQAGIYIININLKKSVFQTKIIVK